jgi:hypothetical protein
VETKIFLQKGRKDIFILDYFSPKYNFSTEGTLQILLENLGFFVRENLLPEQDYRKILNKIFLYFTKSF